MDADFPKKHRTAEIDLPAAPWYANLKKITKMIGTGYIVAICGDRGGGKTQLSYSIAQQTAWKQKTVKYTTAVEFYLEIKESYSKGISEKGVLSKYTAPGLLVLDELQERSDSDWADQLLTYILDKRYGAEKDTVLISNLKPDQFMAHVGPSIADRITETGAIIEADWGSFRKNT
jgi:DNA replication protein DnaC